MSVIQNLNRVRQRIESAAHACGRRSSDIELIAVSKSQPAAALRQAYQAGQRLFGESYLQEALVKIAALADCDIEWHFIGPIQSNKTRPIAEHFVWVHGIDRIKTARRLSEQRPLALAPLQVCLQVNISQEASKSGAPPEAVLRLAHEVVALPRLTLRGLMAIPSASDDHYEQRRQFRMLRHLQQQLIRDGLSLDTLSMGMSDDLEAAIAEGATMVRIGTAIFGERTDSEG